VEEFKNMDKLKDDFFEAIEIICKDYESKHKPEFKAGRWIVTASCNEVKRIKEINGDIIKYDDGCTHTNWKGFIRPATPAEIESHLKKICDKKYIGKKVRDLHYGNNATIVKEDDNHSWFYVSDGDRFIVASNDWITGSNPCVYEKGRFAEIIPDKKKLPKGKDECKNFLLGFVGFINYDYELPTHIRDFLDQYED